MRGPPEDLQVRHQSNRLHHLKIDPPSIQQAFNTCRLHKEVYFLGDLLNPTGTKLRPDAINVTLPQYHDDKFPEIQLPKQDLFFQNVCNTYIRKLMDITPLGLVLGTIMNRRSYEWCLDPSKKSSSATRTVNRYPTTDA